MLDSPDRRCVLRVCIVALVACACAAPASACGRQQDAPSPETIGAWIDRLGSAQFSERDDAMRRLVAIGPAALPALRSAAADRAFEVATRARHVSEWIEALLFTGVEIELGVSRPQIRWDEPFDVTLRLTNRSAFAAVIPFAPSDAADQTGDDDASGHVRRLGLVLDASEFLRVTDPAGEPVELRVDDVSGVAAAERAVDARLGGGPTSRLAPGASVTLRIPAINKGWGRYAFLDRGAYTLDFVYEPPWPGEDLFEPLRQQGVWVARGRGATVTVSEPAPEAVSRSGRQALLELKRAGDDWIARLTCTDDLPLWVNTNFGNGLPFATCRWAGTFGPDRYYVPASAAPVSLKDFGVERLREVKPGEAIEIARISDQQLRAALAAQGADVEHGDWTLHVDYLNLLDRSWQDRNEALLSTQSGVPDILRRPLPQRMLILNVVSLTEEMRQAGK